MESNVILVDIHDCVRGEAPKMVAHKSPLLHRAFSVFLYHDDKLLIQRRALHKYHSGGLWANACCSHPHPGEETLQSANRRLYEELFIKDVKLEEVFSFIYYYQFAETLFEYEYDHVFLGEYTGNPFLNKEEIEESKWISFQELSQKLCDTPQAFAPWFLIAAPRVLQKLKECK